MSEMSGEEIVVVQTGHGSLRGRKVASARRGFYYSFQGIPYGKPPVGDFRFKAPMPADSWSGMRDALTEGAIAPSVDFPSRQFRESSNEDCLYLNVYTPTLPANDSDSLKAVMFWIHGGGFSFGSGNTDLYGPDYLVAEEVVLVTCNYRLGALGFLSLETPECPGNNGLKDIILALKWCQQNISRFGGDPRNVTVFGESAGGAAVHYLTLSRRTEGLFHRAIAQSGVALNPWASARKPRQCAFKLAEALGCKAEDDSLVLEFLRSASAEDLVIKGGKVLADVEPDEYFSENAFVPCVEPEIPEAVITKSPDELSRSGETRRIPLMLGANTLEGIVMTALKGDTSRSRVKVEADLNKLIPIKLKVESGSQKAVEIMEKIRNFYFPNGIDEKGTIHVLSQVYFLNGINQVLEDLRKSSDTASPVFLYLFAYDGQAFTFKHLLGCQEWEGTSHADELIYLFKPSMFDATLPPGTEDYATMEKLVKIWTNFAKFGNPRTEEHWTPISGDRMPYLEINKTLVPHSDWDRQDFDFWRGIREAGLGTCPSARL